MSLNKRSNLGKKLFPRSANQSPAPPHVRPEPPGSGRASGLGLGQGRANIFFGF